MRRVLVVDDEPSIRKMLAVTLDDFGYETFSAPTADSALSALDEVHPDAIVLDVVLPGMDGAELVRRVRRSDEFADLPIVLISAYEEPESHKADRFMRKPLDTMALARTIRDLCRSRVDTTRATVDSR